MSLFLIITGYHNKIFKLTAISVALRHSSMFLLLRAGTLRATWWTGDSPPNHIWQPRHSFPGKPRGSVRVVAAEARRR